MASPNTLHPETKKSKYSRARVACLTCRKRHVRCFVSSDGEPCSNCYLDSCPCIFQTRRRRKITSEAQLVEAGRDYILKNKLNAQYMGESPRDEYCGSVVDMHESSSPASSCSTVTTKSEDQRISAWYAQPSSQLVGQKNAPGWFEVADLMDENEDRGRENQNYMYSLDNLIMDISLLGE